MGCNMRWGGVQMGSKKWGREAKDPGWGLGGGVRGGTQRG